MNIFTKKIICSTLTVVLAVSLTLTPRTDYEQIADILPWAMKLIGMEDYVETINAAVEETGIRSSEMLEKPAEDQGRFD